MTDTELALDAIEYLTGERPDDADEDALDDAGRVLRELGLIARDDIALDGYRRILGPTPRDEEGADVYLALAMREDGDALDALVGVVGTDATVPVASWDLDWVSPEEAIAYELEDAWDRGTDFMDALDESPAHLRQTLDEVDRYVVLSARETETISDASPTIPTDGRTPPMRITRNYGDDHIDELMEASSACLFGRTAETPTELIAAKWLAQYALESGWHAAKVMVRATDDPDARGTFAQTAGMWCLARDPEGAARLAAAVIPFTFTSDTGRTYPTVVGALVGTKACTICSNRIYSQDDVPLTIIVDRMARLANMPTV